MWRIAKCKSPVVAGKAGVYFKGCERVVVEFAKGESRIAFSQLQPFGRVFLAGIKNFGDFVINI